LKENTMAVQGNNPMSRQVDDHLKHEDKGMPPTGLPREDTDTSLAGGQNAIEAEQDAEPARDPQKSGGRQG
jgi:hypothetical protein